ncbi:MAG: class I SAM-dependent methyltransferase [Candidatus Portnoybacteria bacterium]|nr:class I SAM-dependent methyltransferase [Candidatus Portnoybacteria bacterium]
MKITTHKKQKEVWEKEHRKPYVLLQMDSHEPSSGVVLFWEWLKQRVEGIKLKGLDIACGKGRNAIWLARQRVEMTGFDFSSVAIKEAKMRTKKEGVSDKVHFLIHDAAKRWPFPSDTFDFAFDCFASTDIESYGRRTFARDECVRVLKPSGYLLIYTLSTDDEFHTEMIAKYPAKERNAFLHPTTGKFEKTFGREELLDFYKNLRLIEERRIKKKATFFGKEYNCKHFLMIFQK